MEGSVDIFHPLTTLDWIKQRNTVPDIDYYSTHPVHLNGRIYIVARTAGSKSEILLLSFSADFTDCVRLSLPYEGFSLSHYQSQLVLVEDGYYSSCPRSNIVWVSDDGINWQQSFPRRKIERREISVVNTGFPESLVVVGEDMVSFAVEVFINGEWHIALSPPNSMRSPKCYVHHGTLIMVGLYEHTAYCCHVESLHAACLQSQDDEKKLRSHDVWKRFERQGNGFSTTTSIFSFQNQLVAFFSNKVEVFCSYTNTWLELGNLPKFESKPFYRIIGTALATGHMAILVLEFQNVLTVYTATLKTSLFYADEIFNKTSLLKLELAGFDLNKMLTGVYPDFVEAIGIRKDTRDQHSAEKSVAIAFDHWLSHDGFYIPCTWRSLLGVLRELGLKKMTRKIEDYLCDDIAPLEVQSMAVIMSGLLQQRLEPDQLHAKLPDYIPTTLRNAIVCSFKAYALQLVPFPCTTPEFSPSPAAFENRPSSRLLDTTTSSPCRTPLYLGSPIEDRFSSSPSSTFIVPSPHSQSRGSRQRNRFSSSPSSTRTSSPCSVHTPTLSPSCTPQHRSKRRRLLSSSTECSHSPTPICSSDFSSSSLDDTVGHKEAQSPPHSFHDGDVEHECPPKNLESFSDKKDNEDVG